MIGRCLGCGEYFDYKGDYFWVRCPKCKACSSAESLVHNLPGKENEDAVYTTEEAAKEVILKLFHDCLKDMLTQLSKLKTVTLSDLKYRESKPILIPKTIPNSLSTLKLVDSLYFSYISGNPILKDNLRMTRCGDADGKTCRVVYLNLLCEEQDNPFPENIFENVKPEDFM